MDRLLTIDKIPLDTVRNHRIKVEEGVHLTIREYRSATNIKREGPQPALVYFHGGGCVIGSIETHDFFCRLIAQRTAYTVLSVDYRLGPEHKFPAAIDDAVAAWNWVLDHAASLHLNPSLIGVGGDSAGAYLATIIAQESISAMRKRAPKKVPAYQWLLYPMLDLRGETASYQRCTSGMLLTQALMNYFRDHYLNDENERAHFLASPVMREPLNGLPVSYVLTAEHDPLLDSGVTYVEKLRESHCHVEHAHFQHLSHGFISLGGVCPHARNAMDRAIDALARLNIKCHKRTKPGRDEIAWELPKPESVF